MYKEGIESKNSEELELLNVLREYKAKFKDFEKATKKSDKHAKQFEKELKLLNQRQ